MLSEKASSPGNTLINSGKPIRLAILQRVCTTYNLSLFSKIASQPGIKMRLFFGDDLPNSKVRSAIDLSGIDSLRLPTRFISIRGRVLTWHKGLIPALEKFKPDVILCEGESNFLSYMKAIWYRRHHQMVSLIHWSLGGLPGVPVRPRSLKSCFKYKIQKKFDALLVYSSFGKECLIELGHPPEKIFVATNVADTSGHIEQARQMQDSPLEARAKLNLPDRFTILYVGTMDTNKRPDILLDLARESNADHYNFVLLGDGPMLEQLRGRAKAKGLSNVFLPGRVSQELPLYYRASDAMVLPGRGGMVISEAMAWSLPVVVHEADGTEYDLVRDGETGIRLTGSSVTDFNNAVETLRRDITKCKAMGRAGRESLVKEHNIEQMVERIIDAVRESCASRKVLTPPMNLR